VLTLRFSFSHQDTFGLSFSLVDENLLNFSFSFSHSKYHSKMSAIIPESFYSSLMQSHSTQYAQLSAEQ